jgi:isopentenyl-diphosphate delta-isomerase type 1
VRAATAPIDRAAPRPSGRSDGPRESEILDEVFLDIIWIISQQMIEIPDVPTSAGPVLPPGCEPVVLLDRFGRPAGTAPKGAVHGRATPLHLGFSCHVVRADGRLLVTRRAASKRTWPATWSNACCGHPQPGESLRRAVARRLRDELGLVPRRMAVAIPDFTYRAAMADGTVEHEVCPVVVAEVDGDPVLNPDEVDDAEWLTWCALRTRAHDAPESLSPWSVTQIERLGTLSTSPRQWLARADNLRGRDEPAFASGTRAAGDRPGIDPLAIVRAQIDPRLDAFLKERSDAVETLDAALAPVTRAIRALVAAGGKRLRPAFVYWGQRAAGDRDDAAVVPVAAAVELLHAFALLHDDVMDRSETRRGLTAAHRALAHEHRRGTWRGDPDWFGVSAAILAGDLTFVWADELFEQSPAAPAALARARRAFSTLRAEVMAGQYLDLRLAALPCPDEAAARHVALLKSGRYTVTRPLQIGLALATGAADPTVTEALTIYGDAVGLAFQLRDDVLGLFGDPAETGKSTVDDLREGKRTLLVLRALALATPSDRRVLRGALGDPALDDDDADRCRDIVARSGALASIETLLRSQHATAIAALAAVPQPARAALEALASLAIQRRR